MCLSVKWTAAGKNNTEKIRKCGQTTANFSAREIWQHCCCCCCLEQFRGLTFGYQKTNGTSVLQSCLEYAIKHYRSFLPGEGGVLLALLQQVSGGWDLSCCGEEEDHDKDYGGLSVYCSVWNVKTGAGFPLHWGCFEDKKLNKQRNQKKCDVTILNSFLIWLKKKSISNHYCPCWQRDWQKSQVFVPQLCNIWCLMKKYMF